ncbi:alpha-ketoglutarate-dependent dioxygenase AlkB [Chitinophaga sp. HK235]|uniref:alpha-ketoglutarate-dependent dioxygenase AlkB n=1 Tax=Chitinophaga sp. HK235 TaxID=2952571 RepID=UPI001BA58E87|nr:alpha-ketoglutarate-dependent dioxygenase AlkB [Chitinophaga sp. HK235]
MMISSEFNKITLDLETNLFNELLSATDFAPVAKGRIGNHLVKMDGNRIPIVRTTTRYNIPAHDFSAIHNMLVECINDSVRKSNLEDIPALHFNNALIEVYDASYSKMNYHSDQNLDLDNDSYIGLFSCYENPEELSAQHIRKLKIKDKVSEEEQEYSLTHNSVILFSLSTNTKFLHKIVLDAAPKPLVPDNKWLGITFRTSKTYIQFEDDLPRFANGKLLELANKEQETAFYKLRGEENRNLNFVYPDLIYTVNAGDTMKPKHS